MNGSRCRRMLNMVLSEDDETELNNKDDNVNDNYEYIDDVNVPPNENNFSYMFNNSISIEGVESFEENLETSVPKCNQIMPLQITSTKEIPTNNMEITLLDISHSYLKAVEYPSNLLTKNQENTIPTDNALLNTPTSQINKSIAFIASPTILYINKNYDLPNLSDLDDILGTVEKNNSLSKIAESTTSRKRRRNEQDWKDNKNKVFKNNGQSYKSKQSKKTRPKKTMGSPCTCKMNCFEKLDTSTRQKIFNNYWAIGDHERQWDFILRHANTLNIKKMSLERKNNRTQTIEYFLPSDTELKNVTKICKTMFLNTLSITQQVVYTALEKDAKENKIKDLRGTHNNRPKKMTQSTEISIMKHIDLFNRVESHYTRKDTQKEYLDETLNLSKMHRLYLEWIDTEEQYKDVTRATKRQYEFIFNTKYNLSFHRPKKDQCDVCSIFKIADDKRKEELKDAHDKHINAKNIVRQLKDEEKNNFNKNNSVVACFDLQKVLNIPQSEVGVFYYKRKFPIYNFTVYDTLTQTGYCYLWHCQIAKRGAIEIASCLWLFIKDQAELGKKKISLYSDSCGGQNRNRFVFAMLALASKTFAVEITHRFLEKGHSQSEGDSMHATIELAKKKHTIYNADQMYHIIENAKVTGNKYKIKHMEQAEFLNFKDTIRGQNWLNDSLSNKIYWSKIKEITLYPTDTDIIYFRYDFQESPRMLNYVIRSNSRRRRVEQPSQGLPQRAYNNVIPIGLPLYKDLISLCDSGAIPRQYQDFYRSLVPAEASDSGIRNLEDSDEDD